MRILAGILLMGVGFVLLFGIIVIPVLPPTEDSVEVNNYLTPLLCQPGEHLVREQFQTHDSDGTGYSMTPYCVNGDRQREDVSGRWVLIGGGGFVGFFLVGLLLTILSANRRQQRWLQSVPNSSGGTDFAVFASGNGVRNNDIGFSNNTLRVNGFEIKMDGLTPDKINALKAQMQANSTGMNSNGDLSTKLKQLQDAKDKGLLTSEEFDRLRQKILDDIS